MATSSVMPISVSQNTPQATASTSSSSNSSTTVTATDFLTLLVTELKNQDPTNASDPNEYINQLVGINSLEQLISINENLQTALGTTSSSASSQQASETAISPTVHALNSVSSSDSVRSIAGGNLSAPAASHAADQIASALSRTK